MSTDFKELSDALDLEYWAERQGVSYKNTRGRSGPQLNFKECPSCGDRKSKVYLNADTGLGNCFKCDEAFYKLGFIHATLNGTWKQTLEEVKATLKEQGWRPAKKTTAAVEHGEVVLPSSIELPTSDNQNLVYLEQRNVTGEVAKYFHLRYCISGWWNYIKDDGSKGGQKFDDRIIIPVFDLDGTLKTFQGRDITGEAERKYLFPSGLSGTGVYLFNGQNASMAKRLCLVEGAFDVIAAKRAFDEVVDLRDVVPIGSFGKHLSYGSLTGNDQLGRFIQLKTSGLQEVTIMWDGEKQALAAALHTAELLQKVGLIARIALLPFDKDPNEVLAEVVQKAFREAITYTAQIGVRWRLQNPYRKHPSKLTI